MAIRRTHKFSRLRKASLEKASARRYKKISKSLFCRVHHLPPAQSAPLPLQDRPFMSVNQASPMTRYRWVICTLLFFATTINYIDRQILSLIKEILDKEIGWTNTQFGYVNSAFQLAYAFGLLWFGWFIDKYGTKIGYAVSIAAWSVAAMGHALVFTFKGFFIARIALGLGEGGNFPAAIKSAAQWFPKRERAFATSIFNSGSNVGAIVAPAVVPAIAYGLGWHWAFIIAGIAGFVWLAFWLPFFSAPDKSKHVNAAELAHIESDADERANAQAKKISWLSLLGYRQTWAFVLAKTLTDPVWWFFLIWLPDFFKKTYAMDLKKSWVHLVTIYSIITVLSIFGGWISGYLTKRGWSVTRARKTCMFIFACCVLPVFFSTSLGVWPAVFLIALAGAAHQAWSANLFTTVSDTFPKQAIASVVGLGGMAGALGGACFPIVCGMILDRFKAQGNEAGAYTYLLHILAFVYIGTFLIHHLLLPKLEQIKLKEA
jgi:MFS transporter, ACS family, hexuronate transporter